MTTLYIRTNIMWLFDLKIVPVVTYVIFELLDLFIVDLLACTDGQRDWQGCSLFLSPLSGGI